MENVPNPGSYRIYCGGHKGEKRWLVPNDTKVQVVQDSAVTWQVESTSEGMTLSKDGIYIAGDIKDGKVRLTPLVNGEFSAYWDIESSGQYWVIRCLATGSGDKRFLDGNTEKGNVYLNDDTNKSGSQWLLLPA